MQRSRSHEDLPLKYTWETEFPVQPGRPMRTCSTYEAPLIDGLSQGDAEFVDENRTKIFNLKSNLLKVAAKYMERDMGSTQFWEECMGAISAKVSHGDLVRLSNLEDKYADLVLLSDLLDLSDGKPLGGEARDMHPGGVKDVLGFIFFVEEELTIGAIAKIKQTVLPLLQTDRLVSSQAQRAAFEKAASDLLTLHDEVLQLYDAFLDRLENDIDRRVRALLPIPCKDYSFVQKLYEGMEEGKLVGVTFGRPYQLPISSGREVLPISLPPDTRWEDISIEFLDPDYVRIEAKGAVMNSNYKMMGMERKDNGNPTKQWELLLELAEGHGEVHWDSPYARNKNKKRIQLLRRNLKAYFQISVDPFLPYQRVRAYKTRFRISVR